MSLRAVRASRPLGAKLNGRGAEFSLWSDKAREASLVLYGADARVREIPLEPELGGVFSVSVDDFEPGTSYDFRIDGAVVPDPYARFLPDGVHGPAEVWPSLPARVHPKRVVDFGEAQAIYELHVGTFTEQGTFASAMARLPELRELGVTVLELLPLAAFPGRRGWGYDGVALFAPFSAYGTPADLLRLIDAAHGLGLSVLLDVVYNHLGPDGNYLGVYSDTYLDRGRQTPWGDAPNLERPAFRRLVLDSARYWLEDIGFDGLRLDAVHALEPGGSPHIVQELCVLAHSLPEPAVIIAEDERNDPEMLLELGVDAVWSDDFHHVLHVLLTGERQGYYRGYQGNLQELALTIERRQLYQGQVFPATNRPRGKPATRVPRARMIYTLQNHDQIGNRARGERLHALTDLERFAAASLLLLALPATPLLFMGQEWAASSPFLYFSDHAGKLGRAVSNGRRAEFREFSGFERAASVPDPQASETFERCKLDWSELKQREHARMLTLYRRALRLRQTDAVLSDPLAQLQVGVLGSVLWLTRRSPAGTRLVLFNPGGAVILPEVVGCAPRRARLLESNGRVHSSHDVFGLPEACTAIFEITPE